MTRETKAGLVVSCSFLCLVGVVLFNKLNEDGPKGTESPNETELARLMEEPRPVSSEDPGGAPGTRTAVGPAGAGSQEKATKPETVVPAVYQEKDEHVGSHSMPPPKAPPKEPEANEQKASPPSAWNARQGLPGPTPSPAFPDAFPKMNSAPATVKGEAAFGGGAPLPPKVESVPESQKNKPSSAEGRVSEPPAVQPATTVPKEEDKPASLAGKTESVAPTAPSSILKNAIKTGSAANALVSGIPANKSDSWDFGGRDTKPAAPATTPGIPSPSVTPSGAAGGTNPAPSGVFPLPTTNSPGPAGPESPTPVVSGENLAWPAKDGARTEGSPKTDPAPKTPPPTDGHKPVLQMPDPPPPAAGPAVNPQGPTPAPTKPWPGSINSDSTSPAKVPPFAGVDQKQAGSAVEHPASGTADTSSGPGSVKTIFPSPNAHPVSPPVDPAPRPTAGFIPPPSSGAIGLGPDQSPRPGGDGSVPRPNSPPPSQDKISSTDAASVPPAMPTPAALGSTETRVPLGFPAGGPSRSGPPTLSTSPSTPSSAGNSPSRLAAPLGAPAPIAGPPISVAAPAAPSAPVSVNPQVESYDEDTYTCKANDSFRTISQAVYHTDQYERALQGFNRNHPLAGTGLLQDPPVLQPGQAVYIPPVRILEKYYGAPVLNSPPRPPSAPPPARATERSDGAGTAQPANLSLVGFGTPVKTLPSPERPPLYRVHDGGEMMREVALRTLGNADRWTEIYGLNRQFDPKDVIPAGSTLQLPKDAHVNPQDVP